MDTNDCQRELEDAAVRASNSKAHRTTILSVLEDASEVVLRAAERCEDEVAEHAHIIRCLRASRGGTSGTSQTARTQLRHHRLKAMALEDAHLTLTQAIYNKEDKLKPLFALCAGQAARIGNPSSQSRALRRGHRAAGQGKGCGRVWRAGPGQPRSGKPGSTRGPGGALVDGQCREH